MSASSYLNKVLIDRVEIINQARADMISSHVRTFFSHYAYLVQNLNLQPVAKGNVFLRGFYKSNYKEEVRFHCNKTLNESNYILVQTVLFQILFCLSGSI